MEDTSEAILVELLTLRKEISSEGTIRYYNENNKLHRIHGPAVIFVDGIQCWYKNGLKHRPDGPAIEYSDGGAEWWEHGHLLRIEPS